MWDKSQNWVFNSLGRLHPLFFFKKNDITVITIKSFQSCYSHYNLYLFMIIQILIKQSLKLNGFKI